MYAATASPGAAHAADTVPYLTPQQACEYLTVRWNIQMRPSTLARRRTTGGGPRYVRPNGRDPMYPVTSVDSWARAIGDAPVATTAQEPRRPSG